MSTLYPRSVADAPLHDEPLDTSVFHALSGALTGAGRSDPGLDAVGVKEELERRGFEIVRVPKRETSASSSDGRPRTQSRTTPSD